MDNIDIKNLLDGLCDDSYDYDTALAQFNNTKKQDVALNIEAEDN